MMKLRGTFYKVQLQTHQCNTLTATESIT